MPCQPALPILRVELAPVSRTQRVPRPAVREHAGRDFGVEGRIVAEARRVPQFAGRRVEGPEDAVDLRRGLGVSSRPAVLDSDSTAMTRAKLTPHLGMSAKLPSARRGSARSAATSRLLTATMICFVGVSTRRPWQGGTLRRTGDTIWRSKFEVAAERTREAAPGRGTSSGDDIRPRRGSGSPRALGAGTTAAPRADSRKSLQRAVTFQ